MFYRFGLTKSTYKNIIFMKLLKPPPSLVKIEIKDLKIGIEHLQQKFSNLSFGAENEAVYRMGRYLFPEECNNLEDTYDTRESVTIWKVG